MLGSNRCLFIAIACALVIGCGRELDDSTPEGALSLFLDALTRSAHDPAALEDAYQRLDSESQRRLAERAREATALGAREYEPWEMLVEGRATIRFTPRRGSGLRSRAGESDDDAIVVVTGDEPSQRAEIPMHREDGSWRVVMNLPPLRAAH